MMAEVMMRKKKKKRKEANEGTWKIKKKKRNGRVG